MKEEEKNMKKFKIMNFITLIGLMLVLMMGCGSTKSKTEVTTAPIIAQEETQKPEEQVVDNSEITITDMEDRAVTLDQVPQKIAVLLASDVEILYELGAQDSIIAVGEYCNYPAEALEKEVVSTGEQLNIEQIISLAPQVVVIGSMGQTTEQVEQLQNAGIEVVVTNSNNIADTYTAIELLGTISGKEKEATDLIQSMKNEFETISKKVEEKSDKTVYFEVSPLEYGLWTAGKDTFMQELSDIIGVKNAFSDVSGWSEVSEEQVLERNPDYIITSTMYDGEGDQPVDEILGRKNWEKINAVKNKKVYNGDSDMMTRPGPRLVDAAKALYEFIYGE